MSYIPEEVYNFVKYGWGGPCGPSASYTDDTGRLYILDQGWYLNGPSYVKARVFIGNGPNMIVKDIRLSDIPSTVESDWDCRF